MWTSDGTAAGTHIVADLNPGEDGSSPTLLQQFGDRLIFVARADGVTPRIYTTDGSTAGTQPITPATGVTGISHVSVNGGQVYFTLQVGSTRSIVFYDDETASTTTAFTAPAGGTFDGVMSFHDGVLFRLQLPNGGGTQLWRSDGTPSGTLLVSETGVGSGRIKFSYETGGVVYYIDGDGGGSTGYLYRTDGTAAGTARIVSADVMFDLSGLPLALAVGSQGQLILKAIGATVGDELHVINDNVAPLLVGNRNGGSGFDWRTNTARLQLSEAIADLPAVSSVSLVNTTTGAAVDPARFSIDYDINARTLRVAVLGDRLSGGDYQLVVQGGSFTDLAGNTAGEIALTFRTYSTGDVNGDFAVNNLDIAPFVTLLTSPVAFATAYPGVDPLLVGDINGDGVVNNLDIAPFVALLTGGRTTAVAPPPGGVRGTPVRPINSPAPLPPGLFSDESVELLPSRGRALSVRV